MDSIRKIIKIYMWGKTAHFRIYGNQNFCDSYPLPPPSTVLGILREAIGERPPEPIILAIKGKYEGIFFDYKTFLNNVISLDSKDFKNEWWVSKMVNRSLETQPLYIKVFYKPCYVIYLYTPEHHDFYLSKLYNPQSFISLGRSEDLAMIKAVSTEAKRKEAKKKDKIKIENSYLPKEVYGCAKFYLPVSHLNRDRNLEMKELYYIQEMVSYYEGEYWETPDNDKFLWILEYNNTASGNRPVIYGSSNGKNTC